MQFGALPLNQIRMISEKLQRFINIDLLLKAGAEVTAFDPEAMDNVKAIYGNKITFAGSQNEAIENCDALLICTEWQVFRTPDFDQLRQLGFPRNLFLMVVIFTI